MNALVCISHVPDTTTVIKFNADGSDLDKSGVTFVINPYDEYGLVRAIELREQTGDCKVTALCVGGAEVEPTLRKALAIGADQAVRIDGKPGESRFVAEQIASYAKENNFDVIFAGKESIDFNGSEVPGMLAELMDLPFVSNAIKLDIESGSAKLHREIDGGYEVVESSTPLVVSCQKGMSEWRIPNMRGIMQARTKPLNVVAPKEVKTYVKTESLALPPEKGGCTYIDPENAGELINILNNKGLI